MALADELMNCESSPVQAWTERAFVGICRPYIAEIRAAGRIEFMNAGAAQLADWDAKDAPLRAAIVVVWPTPVSESNHPKVSVL
jgi:hypothetical protein